MIKIDVKSHRSFNTKLLVPKKELFPEFWENNVLNPKASARLLEIAQNIVDSMEIDAEIKDMVVTGSIASYNWHEMSDIDLHIVLNFEEIDENFVLVKKMLDQSRINWNKTHNIFIADKEVELYFQDENESHEANGIWSLSSNRWLAEPIRLDPELDLKTSEKKAETMARAIDYVSKLVEEEKYENAYEYASKVKNKISRMRKAGLVEGGIYSPENLAFKMLRNSDYLEKISFLKVLSYDKMMSLNSVVNEVKDYFNNSADSEYLEFDNHAQASIEKLLNEDEPAPWDDAENYETI